MRLENEDVLLHWPLAQHIITADQVWAYTESDPPKITEDEALAICGPRPKSSGAAK